MVNFCKDTCHGFARHITLSFLVKEPISAPDKKRFRTNSMYWDRQVSANSADQDQTASEEAV